MTAHPQRLTRAEIRALLWDTTFLGSQLASLHDDHLDDVELDLDSLRLVLLVTELEQRTGAPVEIRGAAEAFQTVSGIERHLRKGES